MASFFLSGNISDLITCHDSVILVPNTNCEAALLSLDTYNSILNIAVGKNNIFTYSTDAGITWKNAINNEIKREILANGDDGSALNISANISRLTSIVTIEHPNYIVECRVANSTGSLFGFDEKVIGHGYNESTNIVNIYKLTQFWLILKL